MFHYESAVFFILSSILLVTVAFDVTETKVEHIKFTEKDVVPKSELATTRLSAKREFRFIGDLILGDRHADETVFRRSVEVSNPTDQVYSTAISLSVSSGSIHYLSVLNEQGSFAVACDEPYTLGSSRSTFNVRVPPNTKSMLSLLVASH